MPLPLLVLVLPVLARATVGGMTSDSSLDDLLGEWGGHGFSGSLKSESIDVRERVKKELDKLERVQKDHDTAHDVAVQELEKFEGEHLHLKAETSAEAQKRVMEELAKLRNLNDHDHVALKSSNDESRERVAQELAKLEVLQQKGGLTSYHKSAHEYHSGQLTKLDMKNELFELHREGTDEARERAEQELAKLEDMHKEEHTHAKLSNDAARERVKQELGKLTSLHEHDHDALKADNVAARDRVKQELAKLEAMKDHTGQLDAHGGTAHAFHSRELAALEMKEKIFDAHAAKLGFKANKEDVKARVARELAKLKEHQDTATGLRGKRHILKRDSADSLVEALSLAQHGAKLIPATKAHASHASHFLMLGTVCAGTLAVLSFVGKGAAAGSAVRYEPFRHEDKGKGLLRSKGD